MRAWGVEVTTLSEAEMQKFRAAVRPMYERFAEQAELIPANTGSVTPPVPRLQKLPLKGSFLVAGIHAIVHCA